MIFDSTVRRVEVEMRLTDNKEEGIMSNRQLTGHRVEFHKTLNQLSFAPTKMAHMMLLPETPHLGVTLETKKR